ncbi:glycosyltransferase [Paenibacillus cymbidii]|uniref:glycosyltransferase n=1 Tax=Paenibacillus cymbidii TaxID=1639034 RepID=UPI001080B18E|nr:glycosyltransferase [Paenibacillus cymbidii]
MVLLVLCVIGCLAGMWLFRNNRLAADAASGAEDGKAPKERKLSVIIPARNEQVNLPHLLGSLREMTFTPHEIIVVDDFSDDRTYEIAASFGVTVIRNTELPPGWTGKNWAVWNGYRQATGDLIAFLDADIRLAPDALAALIATRDRCGGVISVVPFHYTEKLYERLALVTNLLGAFAFTSPAERRNPRKGLYGSCIVTTREDYELVSGHSSVRGELLDDLNLGAKYTEAGIPVTNFLGCGLVSFRMYPQGIRSELEGFSKGAVLSTGKLRPGTIVCVALWMIGLIAAESALFAWGTSWAVPLGIAYALYTAQIVLFGRYVGKFGWFVPLLHPLSTLFFLVVMAYSAYQVLFLGHVAWKGRNVKVGGKPGA